LGSLDSFSPSDVDLSNTKRLKKVGNYFYIYEVESSFSDNYVYFRYLDSYTVTDSNKTVKLYDYFLVCDSKTLECFTNEANKNNKMKSNITYSANLNLKDYEMSLDRFEHTFIYKDGHYYWKSSEKVVE